MAKNPFKSAEFLSLQAKWNARLAAEGLGEPKGGRISQYSSWVKLQLRGMSEDQKEARTSYYLTAKDLLLTFPFKNSTHRKIWELHCEGLSKRKIARAIKGMSKSYRREQVGNIINEIKETMK